MNKLLTIILGPTAVGKSGYAVEFAQKIGSPIISCDSRQLYKELNIGVARPEPEQLQAVKHYFIADHSISDYYTAGLYEIEAMELLQTLFQSHDHLVMAGGSGLYIDALCSGLDDFPAADQELRSNLMRRYDEEGAESLRADLKLLDKESYLSIDIANKQRLIRALEVTISTGKPFSQWKTMPRKERPFKIEKIGLMRPREELYKRIDDRVDIMMQQGLLQEAEALLPFRNLPALNTVGYKELFDHFDGKISLDEAVDRIKRNSRHYAKRQITYWKRDSQINYQVLK
ncbi:MAG: tRNA (adenosine(37)-N6)-dimethylallyltransferase MiaA [Bacteroidales bacterium]|nr:tRNA (adenosine(37)-N6)-dimethylallyltransferase MiaA [Bacteroidales bacterium]